MFSFAGDTVLDPFCGTGTSMLAAMSAGRNSIAVKVDSTYIDISLKRIEAAASDLWGNVTVQFEDHLAPGPVMHSDNGAVKHTA